MTQINTIICFVKINHLSDNHKKVNSCSIYQLSCSHTRGYAQTNLIYQRPSFSRDLYWPIKYQTFCDQTINSPYIYTPNHQTKNKLAFHVEIVQLVEFVKSEPEIRLIWLWYKLVGTLIIFITVISTWCYGYSKYSKINLYIKERMKCSE